MLMKHTRWLFLLMLIGLAGCNPTQSVVPSSTPAVTAVPVTKATTTTKTETPRPTRSPTSIPSPTSTPSPTATPPRLSSLGEDKTVLFFHDGGLWVTDLAGRDVIQINDTASLSGLEPGWNLSSAKGLTAGVQFSPDRRWLVVPRGNQSSFLFDLRGGRWWALPRDIFASWSPDSRQLAYVWHDWYVEYAGGELKDREGVVYVYDVYRESGRRLFRTEALVEALWSPDGTNIAVWAFNQSQEGGGDVWLLNPLTGRERKVGSCVNTVATSAPSLQWSADGQQLAMAQRNNGVTEWAVLSLESGAIERFDLGSLPQDRGWLLDPDRESLNALSHSGEWLARAVPPRKSGQEKWWAEPSRLLVLDAQTETTVREWQVEGIVPIVRWSADDAWLVFGVLQVKDLPCEITGFGSDGKVTITVPEWGPCDIRSSVWRLRTDGTGKMEVVVEEGFLLDVIPQWTKE